MIFKLLDPLWYIDQSEHQEKLFGNGIRAGRDQIKMIG